MLTVEWTQNGPATLERPGPWPHLDERYDMGKSTMPHGPDGRFVARPLSERFWSRVDRSAGPDGCWLWQGGKRHGYGSFAPGGHAYDRGAHRVALEMALGRPLRSDEQACHRCDNPPCVNPAHLFVGTARDNKSDQLAKGRFPDRSRVVYSRGDGHYSRQRPELLARGERHGQAKLTDADVRAIRDAYRPGLGASLGRQYGIGKSQVSRIVRGLSR